MSRQKKSRDVENDVAAQQRTDEMLEDGSRGMFSSASFGAVLDAGDSGAKPVSARSVAERPIIAFYGFRGGSGRTTALTHIAATYSARGRTVVAVDLDLEAPGLHTVLRCAEPDEGTGSLALLRAAEKVETSDAEELTLAPHLISSGEGLPAVRVLPAGKIGVEYYAALDLLNPSLWHVMEGASPLRLLFDRIRAELDPDLILVDCRTGLAPLAATAVFHEADIVVGCFSATRQSHAGAKSFVETLRAAQSRRHGSPLSILVPTMFVENDEGLRRRAEIVEALDETIRATAPPADIDDAELFDDAIVIVGDGVPFRTSLSSSDVMTSSYEHVAGRAYESLVGALDDALGIDRILSSTKVPTFDSRKVLEELNQTISGLAFAEDVAIEEVVKWFLEPTALRSILSNSTFYIVGAKGSGKSWLYKRMVSGSPPLDADQTFLRGHGPLGEGRADTDFTVERIRTLDKKFSKRRSTFEASFWRLRAAATLLRQMTVAQATSVLTKVPSAHRAVWRKLADRETPLFDAVSRTLESPEVEILSEGIMPHIDQVLAASARSRLVLAYDALDTGFGSSKADLERRQRFVAGLIEALEGVRGRLRMVGFKVMLREDVFSQLEVQNKSHLRTATVELIWRPVDAWKLALNVAVRSDEYRRLVHVLDPAIQPAQWPDDVARLVRLLEPLWGAQIERGRKVSSVTFVQRRTSDGRERLFPRTLVEMLRAAVQYEIKRGSTPPDRVLASAALQQAYREASRQRIDDLKAEYAEVSPYLEAMSGMNPTATRAQLLATMQNKMRNRKGTKRKTGGVERGVLHAGTGGWKKVVDRLLEIGVLNEYKRATGESGEAKYEVALLYRAGLGVRLVGL